ncbi:TetR/AcrR family transcriptional regulator [Anaeromicropila herbilytica]|uniref:TetR family transcriptional regulator n=1 Tax=Anaeromicropila herbilytica TaxID=2785025 RepID=A0A7R7EJB0_9FIRM|nr:TetR/AcrR family transcriptional regulator [Anaeromicropila herbilytica]BCN29876.1 TetR family transcriptional regulator [Anaeromicropila herbilytica]
MRISKEPEVRKREIADTAMRIFAEKGYEATSMKDIAKAVNVVPGLCYNYFKSKYELYEYATNLYAEECIKPLVEILQNNEETLEIYLEKLSNEFIKNVGKEKYHDFFHKEGNQLFHKQLEIIMNDKLQPYIETFIVKLNQKGILQADDPTTISKFIVYGQSPIINDDSLTSEEKVDKVISIIKLLLK